MCHRIKAESLPGPPQVPDSNNNSPSTEMAVGFLDSQSWADPRPSCPCMAGDRRVRRRHPATVQTPGRALAEGEVMEPLITSNRLYTVSERLHAEPMRDFNDNYTCDQQDKFYEVQFAIDFSHLRTAPAPPRFGHFDDSSSRESLKKNRILSSKLK